MEDKQIQVLIHIIIITKMYVHFCHFALKKQLFLRAIKKIDDTHTIK